MSARVESNGHGSSTFQGHRVIPFTCVLKPHHLAYECALNLELERE